MIMKVESKDSFQPVTIVLESKAEVVIILDTLRAALYSIRTDPLADD